MEWLTALAPLLGIGADLLGTLFGNQDDEKQSQNVTQNTATVGGITQDDTTQLNGKTTERTNQHQHTFDRTNQNSKTRNKQYTHDSTNQNVSGTSKTSQDQQTSRLDDATQQLLTQQVNTLLRGATTGQSAIQNQIKTVQGQKFDSDAFVKGIMRSATATANQNQESDLSAIAENTGGTTSTNSAAALLANKVRTNTASQLAGVRAQATGEAADIQGKKSSELIGLSGAANDSVSALLMPLLQATERTTGSGSQTDAQRTSGNSNQQSSSFGAQDTKGTDSQSTNINGTNTQNVNQTQKSKQNQKNTQASNTTAVTDSSKNQASHNWDDFFKNVQKAFTSGFFKPIH